MADVYGFDADGVERIQHALDWVERLPENLREPRPAQAPVYPRQLDKWINVTSATIGAHGYPAKIQKVDGTTDPPTWSDLGDCWARGPNNEALPTGRYRGLGVSLAADGLIVFVVPPPPAGASTPAFSGFHFYLGADQSLADSATIAILTNSVDFNIGGFGLPGIGVTIPATGYYLLGGMINWEPNVNGARVASIGTATLSCESCTRPHTNAGLNTSVECSLIVKCNVNDNVKLQGSQNSGAALHAKATYSNFWGVLLGT